MKSDRQPPYTAVKRIAQSCALGCRNVPVTSTLDRMKPEISELARQALGQIEPMEAKGWQPAQSIARQLRWCLAFALGEKTAPLPGPFTMGLIATREFDMYGSQPDLALLVNRVQREVERVLV